MGEPLQIDKRLVNVALFNAQVADYLAAMRLYEAHIATGGQHYPPPDAPALVLAAVDAEHLVPNFVVVGPSLEELRQELYARVNALRAQADQALMPPGRRKLLELDAADAAATPEEQRTDANNAALAKAQELAAQQRTLARHAGRLMSEIDDLATESDAEAWTPAPFP